MTTVHGCVILGPDSGWAGKVHLEGFRETLCPLGVLQAEADAVFKTIDLAGTGAITQRQWRAFFDLGEQIVQRHVRQLQNREDPTGSPRLLTVCDRGSTEKTPRRLSWAATLPRHAERFKIVHLTRSRLASQAHTSSLSSALWQLARRCLDQLPRLSMDSRDRLHQALDFALQEIRHRPSRP